MVCAKKLNVDMKAKQVELEIVKYFIRKGRYTTAQIGVVHANVVATRQMRQSTVTTFVGFFGFLILGTVINNLQVVPYHIKIGEILMILSMATGLLFGIRALMKFYMVYTFCGHGRNTTNESVATDILEAMKSFRKLTGKRPEKLGQVGTAKLLTAEAKTILHLKAMNRSEAEYNHRKWFGKVYDSAKALMPVPRYEDIFPAAESGAEMPHNWYPSFVNS